jgi:hypothetical protein
MSKSNTVQACVAKFLRSKHREEFMANNPWMSLPVAAVVFFRRHTAHKTSYATYREIDINLHSARYLAEYRKVYLLPWYEIPVSQKQCARIRRATLEKYNDIIAYP